MYASQEVGQVSQNLSLRRSPERKYPPQPQDDSQPGKLSTSSLRKCPRIYCCCPSICCHCCCCHCCCCNPCCCLNFDYSTNSPYTKLNDPCKNENENINSSAIGSTKYQTNQNPNPNLRGPNQRQNTYFSYEQNQFNDLLRKLMDVESKIEDAKINLAFNPDFNCEDAFRLFETDDKGYLDENDLKNGLNLIGVFPTDQEIRLLMKRFDLQKRGNINYADFFDIVVPFEKNYRMRVENRCPNSCCPCRCPEVFNPKTINELKELFNLIINSEVEINNMRKLFGTLRLNLRDIFGLVDKNNCGFFSPEQLIEYLEENRMLNNNRDSDLLFIRLDKNRNGKIDFSEVEDETQTLY